MHATIPFPAPPSSNKSSGQNLYKMLRVASSAELPQQSPSEEELRLQTQIRALQEELRQAQRQLAQYEVLLRNARLRELELRAESLKRK
jgi:hypothetical protein